MDIIYQITRQHHILHFSLKLERLGFIKITETGQIDLQVQLLIPEKQLEDLGILSVTRGEIKLLTRKGQDLNILLDKLISKQ